MPFRYGSSFHYLSRVILTLQTFQAAVVLTSAVTGSVVVDSGKCVKVGEAEMMAEMFESGSPALNSTASQ